MFRLCEAVILILKALFFSLWGLLRTILPTWRSNAPPDYSADICLVTGAGQGLGRQLAFKFAETGATMVLWDINEEKVKRVADEIQTMGNEVFSYVCDCSKREDVYHVAEQVKEEVGDVAILVNNAGVVAGRKLMELDDSAIEKTFQVNTLAHIWTVKAFLPWMLANNYGHIVQIASVCAFTGIVGLSDYCASKSAAVSFAETLRLELQTLKKNGISVTCVCPFHISTGMFEGARLKYPSLFPELRAEDVAERTLRAVTEGQFMVVLPRLFYLTSFVKSVLPTRATDSVMKLVGCDTAMKEFTGHHHRHTKQD